MSRCCARRIRSAPSCGRARMHADALRPQSWSGKDGISPAAVIDPTAQLEDDVIVDPQAVIGPDVEIGAGTMIGPAP